MRQITVTHANNNQSVVLNCSTIFYFHFSEAQKSVIVVSNAGAYLPVLETVQQIQAMINGETNSGI